MSVVSAAVALAGVGMAAYGLKRQAKAEKDAKKLPTTARERIRQIEKQVASLDKKLTTATDPKKIETIRTDIQDLRDEKTILEKDLATQHDVANDLSGKTDPNAPPAVPLAKPGMSAQTKGLLIGGAVLAVGAGVLVIASTRKRR